MNDETLVILKRLFPSLKELAKPQKERSYQTNDIIPRNVVIIGSQSSAKTGLARDLAEIAISKYGKENVNVAYSKKNIAPLFKAINGKLVQILICDDITLSEQDQKELSNFFQVRHLMESKGRTNGLVITVLITHSLFGIKDKELRSTIDLIVFKSAPSPYGYDRSVTKQIIGQTGLYKLDELEALKQEDRSYKAWGVAAYRGIVGFMYSEEAKTDYLKDVSHKGQIWKAIKWIVVFVVGVVVLKWILSGRRRKGRRIIRL